MKILTGFPQPNIARQSTDNRVDSTESAAAGQKPAAKQPENGDRVELSATPASELKNQHAEQLKRVETIKSLVASGKYRVSSRAVAEKMLSRSSSE